MLLTIDERGSKIVRNRVFDCHLSPDRRQMAIVNTVSSDWLPAFVDLEAFFDCRLSGVRIRVDTKLSLVDCNYPALS